MLSVSSSSHRSQVLVSELVLSAGGRGRAKKGAAGSASGAGGLGGPTYNEEGFLEDDQYVSILAITTPLCSYLLSSFAAECMAPP